MASALGERSYSSAAGRRRSLVEAGTATRTDTDKHGRTRTVGEGESGELCARRAQLQNSRVGRVVVNGGGFSGHRDGLQEAGGVGAEGGSEAVFGQVQRAPAGEFGGWVGPGAVGAE